MLLVMVVLFAKLVISHKSIEKYEN